MFTLCIDFMKSKVAVSKNNYLAYIFILFIYSFTYMSVTLEMFFLATSNGTHISMCVLCVCTSII